MNDRYRLCLALLAGVTAAMPAAALDKQEKQFLELVEPIMTTTEAQAFKTLKSKEDRAEFQKIFWARRDPDLETPENEFQPIFTQRREEATKRFKGRIQIAPSRRQPSFDSGGFAGEEGAPPPAAMGAGPAGPELKDVPGHLTDCGRTFIVLGEPEKVEPLEGPKGTRTPERWTYPSQNVFLAFDGNCALPGGDAVREQILGRLITQLNIDYPIQNGKLTKKLADMLPKPTPAQALIKEGRQDFPMALEAFYLKIQDGGTGLFGLAKGDAAALTVDPVKKTATVIVRAEVANEQGRAITFTEAEPAAVPVRADGSVVVPYRLGLHPGKYILKTALLDPKTGKGSSTSQPVEVPSFALEDLTIASLFLLEGLDELKAPADANDMASGFVLGSMRLRPRFGAAFDASESLTVSYQLYAPRKDPATQKPSTTVTLRILNSAGQPTARANPQSYETEVAGSVIGPVPLTGYTPGKYKVELKVTDNVAKKDYFQTASFEIVKK